MHDEGDRPITEEEWELARKGEELIAAAVADVRAPQSLREAIERDRGRTTARAPASFWRRHRWALGAAGAVAAALAGVVIALDTGGNTTEPSLTKVYATARLAPTEAAPARLGGSPPVLDANVGKLEFPDWQRRFGWKAVGSRNDTLSGRPVTTVFYRNPEGARLGYAVVSGDPLGGNPPGRQVTRNGKAYKVARAGERTIVTWTQQGHTCAIVGPSVVPRARLVGLAASRNV
jgi:anti-sigma factor RsiW